MNATRKVSSRYDYLLDPAPSRDFFTREFEATPQFKNNRALRHSSDFYYNELLHDEKYQLMKELDNIRGVDRTPVDSEWQMRTIPIKEYQKKYAPWRREPEPEFEEYFGYDVERVPVNTRYE